MHTILCRWDHLGHKDKMAVDNFTAILAGGFCFLDHVEKFAIVLIFQDFGKIAGRPILPAVIVKMLNCFKLVFFHITDLFQIV